MENNLALQIRIRFDDGHTGAPITPDSVRVKSHPQGLGFHVGKIEMKVPTGRVPEDITVSLGSVVVGSCKAPPLSVADKPMTYGVQWDADNPLLLVGGLPVGRGNGDVEFQPAELVRAGKMK